MPLPLIPIVLGAASLAAGAVGIKKGVDAKRLYERAKEIGKRAERRHRRAIKELEARREQVFEDLKGLGEKKRAVFLHTAHVLVESIQQARASANLADFALTDLPVESLDAFEQDIAEMSAIDVVADSAKGAALAALGAGGIYGAVGALGAASTGTAIASLSGAAATNATLAWLGGGSLAAGGLGVAGGSYVLGGAILGPALAIAGFTLASKAEEALTEAEAYAAEAEEKIAALQPLHVMLDALAENIAEVEMALDHITATFEQARQTYAAIADQSLLNKMMCRVNAKKRQQHLEALDTALGHMIAIFKVLKEIVQQPLLDERQMPLVGLKKQLAHKLEVANIPILPPQGSAQSS